MQVSLKHVHILGKMDVRICYLTVFGELQKPFYNNGSQDHFFTALCICLLAHEHKYIYIFISSVTNGFTKVVVYVYSILMRSRRCIDVSMYRCIGVSLYLCIGVVVSCIESSVHSCIHVLF